MLFSRFLNRFWARMLRKHACVSLACVICDGGFWGNVNNP